MPDVNERRRSVIPVAILVIAVFALLSACGGDDEVAADLHLSPLAAEGRHLVETEGCAACHGGDGRGVVGPALTGLVGAEVELDDGTTTIADDDYLLRSILDPGADVRAGFTVVMPPNTLTEADAEAVLAYLKELP